MTPVTKPTESPEIRCAVWVPSGRCRNKVVIQAPNGSGGMKSLCRNHADQEAHRIVMENHRLYWALAWQGAISDA